VEPSTHAFDETKRDETQRDTQRAWEQREGPVARQIERQTARLPSDTFLWAAFASMAASFGLQLYGRKQESLFVGQWAAPFLLFGIYNKLVKVAGSDRVTH